MSTFVDQAAVEYLNWLGSCIHECDLPANDRVRAAVSCLAIAQDHHHGILILIDHERYASAFALLRVAFEAYVRGEWLAACATDEEVHSFIHGKEPPKFRLLLERLEKTEGFQQQVLSMIKAHAWDAMCAYTHTGGLHIQRWNSAEAIEPQYEEQEIREVLSFAETIGSLAVIGVAKVADDVDAARKVLDGYKLRIAK